MQHREWDGRQISHFLTIFCLRTELTPLEQTQTRRTSRQAVEAVRTAWGKTAAWTHREARVVTVSGPPNPGSRSTVLHWRSSLTTRTPMQWVIMPFLVISLYLCHLSSWQCLSDSSLVRYIVVCFTAFFLCCFSLYFPHWQVSFRCR